MIVTKETLIELFLRGIETVSPENLIRENLRIFGPFVKVVRFRFRGGVHVLGSGKAAFRMAAETERTLRDRILGGVVLGPKGEETPVSKRIKFLTGTHPLPSQENLRATEEVLNYLASLSREDRFIFLLSGGTSALLEKPIPPLTLEELAVTTDLLLKSGMPIEELNVVRKHLSLVKGGRLSQITEAKGYVLVLSDVVGDDLSSIGSGPFYPDPSTYTDAYTLLREYGLWDRVPANVRGVIEAGMEGQIPETLKEMPRRIRHIIIGNNRRFLLSVRDSARRMGLRVRIITDTLRGEAREVAKVLHAMARHVAFRREPFSPPILLLFGGETTVSVKGEGIGGRNQELALAFLLEMEGDAKILLLSAGTDGIDGSTDAAGAVVGNEDLKHMDRKEMRKYLRRNDSYNFHRRYGTLLITGPTGTNVADVVLLYVEGRRWDF
ncbi:MAG: glycerate kinase [Thermotogae bacterium]|nr:glycerate kinase [Thermotogota bacterium]